MAIQLIRLMKKYFYTMLVFLFCFFSLILTAQTSIQKELHAKKAITIIDRTTSTNDGTDMIGYAKRLLFEAIYSAGGSIEQVQHWTQTEEKMFLVLGTVENAMVRRLVENNEKIDIHKSEGIFYHWQQTESGTALVVGGTDESGFMYAASELAQQINDKGLFALSEIENKVEYPDNAIRGVDKFIKDQNDDSWFFSEEYWHYYLGQLAQNRFNRFTLISGYNDGKNQDFLIPVYPYLVKVPGYELVSLKKEYQKSPKEYREQLSRIGQLCHSYGLEFVFGIWGHGRSDELVAGLPENAEEYTQYCSLGIKTLLRQVPEIDGIQLRVNYESGVGGFGETAENFWKDIINAIGTIYHERNGKLSLDIRAKGLTPKIMDWTLETGIDLNVTSKYTWEGVGLPFHPIQMRSGELKMLDNIDKRQRYGYADFLKNERSYDFIYRLWGIGTNRIFTWADPDYARQFSKSTSFGGAKGFQVTPPMTRKTNTWNLIKYDSLSYYQWEDQRYWAWYVLFGRLGYSANTDSAVWQRAFKQHYGHSYKAVLNAYRSASKVLPLITSSHLTYHPANYNWAEMDAGGALFNEHNANPFHKKLERTYQSAEPGDPGLFYGINQYVKDFLDGMVQPKINPVQLVALFGQISEETLQALEKVDEEAIPAAKSLEYQSNKTDLQILAALAAYHSLKTRAATDFVFYLETKQIGYVLASLESLEKAKLEWRSIVNLISELYHEQPLFLHDNGTWTDRLVEIEKDIQKLHELCKVLNRAEAISHWDKISNVEDLAIDKFEAVVPNEIRKNDSLKVILKTGIQYSGKQIPKVHLREANMAAGAFKQMEMEWNGKSYVATIPLDSINLDYDLLVYFSAMSLNGHVHFNPGSIKSIHDNPYYIVEIKD